MIARIRLGRHPAGLLAYLSRSKAEPENLDVSRLTGVRPLGLGLEPLDDGWCETTKRREEAFETASIAIRALAACRSDLKHRVAHLVLSADPAWAQRQSRSQVRRAYLCALDQVAKKIGLDDRCGVAVLHRDGHGQARAARFDTAIEHLHAVFALPHADTLRSIAAHQLQARTATACRSAWLRLSLDPGGEKTTPFTPAAGSSDLDAMLLSIARQERRRRQRDRDVER